MTESLNKDMCTFIAIRHLNIQDILKLRLVCKDFAAKFSSKNMQMWRKLCKRDIKPLCGKGKRKIWEKNISKRPYQYYKQRYKNMQQHVTKVPFQYRYDCFAQVKHFKSIERFEFLHSKKSKSKKIEIKKKTRPNFPNLVREIAKVNKMYNCKQTVYKSPFGADHCK